MKLFAFVAVILVIAALRLTGASSAAFLPPLPDTQWTRLTVVVTAYDVNPNDKKPCYVGDTTATGVHASIGSVAVDPRVIPLGARIDIPGYGMGIANDTGTYIVGKHIDVAMMSCRDAVKWGHPTLTVRVSKIARTT